MASCLCGLNSWRGIVERNLLFADGVTAAALKEGGGQASKFSRFAWRTRRRECIAYGRPLGCSWIGRPADGGGVLLRAVPRSALRHHASRVALSRRFHFVFQRL